MAVSGGERDTTKLIWLKGANPIAVPFIFKTVTWEMMDVGGYLKSKAGIGCDLPTFY